MIQLKPDYANAYSNRGAAKTLLGKHQDALTDLNKAIQLRSDDAGAYKNRGLTLKISLRIPLVACEHLKRSDVLSFSPAK